MRPLIYIFFFFLIGCSTVKSQSGQPIQQVRPEMQPSGRQSKVIYAGRGIFKAYRALIESSDLQLIKIYPGAAFISLYDCGWGKNRTCPYMLYIYTDEKLTCKVKLEPAKTYRILYRPPIGWVIEEETR